MLSSSRNIVVIAPDLGLRQSLMFALEVEGYVVEAYDSWRNGGVIASPTLCLIVDDQAIRSCNAARRYLLDSGHVIILLTDGMSPPLGDDADPTLSLAKPFDGAELLGMVKSLAMAA